MTGGLNQMRVSGVVWVSAPGLGVESPLDSPEHQTEYVHHRRLVDTPLRSGDLDRLLEPSKEAESLPYQLPPQNTEAEMAGQNPDTEVIQQTGILSIHAMLRQDQLRWSGHLVRMDDDRLPKRLFYGDVTTSARRQEGQKRRYKDTEKISEDRPLWRRSVKTGSAIYEAKRIAAAKAEIAARKSLAPRTNTVDDQALPKCPRSQRIFHARIGLVGYLRMQCTNNLTIPTSTPIFANPPSDSPTHIHGINSITLTIIETTSRYSSPGTPYTATTTAFVAAAVTPKLSSIRPHIQLKHQPGQSLTNPSYRDW
ncbi:unnamed protein product [Schistocephalus solidus]|uniref:Uncharacterized protein n=1 Tax=Schistocephalus solidus TaxID=70667 RepID=A0A183THB4_SCHSO|nr:unnamed protein product [Schistocephalus solidus]